MVSQQELCLTCKGDGICWRQRRETYILIETQDRAGGSEAKALLIYGDLASKADAKARRRGCPNVLPEIASDN